MELNGWFWTIKQAAVSRIIAFVITCEFYNAGLLINANSLTHMNYLSILPCA